MNDAIPELYQTIRDLQQRIAKLEHQIQEIPNVWVISAIPARLRKGAYILIDPSLTNAPQMLYSDSTGTSPTT
jgi:hypothetical protein